jgi:hypothetical protein
MELHPFLLAKLKPSIMAIASPIIAEDIWGTYLHEVFTKLITGMLPKRYAMYKYCFFFLLPPSKNNV